MIKFFKILMYLLFHVQKVTFLIKFIKKLGMVIKEEKFMSEILKIKYPKLNYCILSGPSFAEEMM